MSRLPGLDLLRAIAIVWVMLFHSWLVGGLGALFEGVQNYGWMGVDLFFVLSGYLIGAQLLRPLAAGAPLDFGGFYLRRTFRVLPAYLVVLTLYFCVPGFREKDGIQPLWQFLTYTVNFLIDYEHNQAFSHVWSLCVEEHFYLVFPWLAWFLVRRRSATAVVVTCVMIVLGGMLLRGLLWKGSDHFVELIYFPTYNRLDGLLAGVLLATLELFRPRTWMWMRARANTVLLPVGIAVFVASCIVFSDRAGLFATLIGYPLLSLGMALLVASATAPQSFVARIRIPGASWLALTSYSLYLVHKAVFGMVAASMPEWLAHRGFVTFLAYAIASLLAGAALHYAVERPFLRLRDWLLPARNKGLAVASCNNSSFYDAHSDA
ncbi:peptidoglycan/LPS O-acetylase OafA/YrhL [Luteibacter rhizovicinus]|uniref:Peptidoglycan/LPS O-acetylase OafA/YrhL n=1 Tax=Luteibacter rhizovicinus TaxID=242606 RepID=A0A4R3YIZ9_9GAMM|nr:acyltransferase [Luteibacter rhizovicinus]TCV92091.1 peptidoglycan/LPS O-acetylase OafA/YrhL [Luteibacter rhizovicinus]